jgi:(E)-4-hydroxy-3-methylbut-2-enyl-diphosphate synthase
MNTFKRRKTVPLKVGSAWIGGDSPILVQSMSKTNLSDYGATIAEVQELEACGCELVRLAVPDMARAKLLGKVKAALSIPIAADIHFDYRLALEALEQGVDKLRLNPGNIKAADKIVLIAKKAQAYKVPIRVGVNAGSVAPEIKAQFQGLTPEALVESALQEIALLERIEFFDIIVSLKAYDIPLTLKAYQLLSHKVKYPFHIGITEAGPGWRGIVRSTAGAAALLGKGLGDTLRVSLTAPAREEVKVAWEILRALELRPKGLELVSCPTCGRTEVDLQSWVQEVEKAVQGIEIPLRVAVMGCVVNGPGEAKMADIGIAGNSKGGILFKAGKIVKHLTKDEVVKELLKEIISYQQKAFSNQP